MRHNKQRQTVLGFEDQRIDEHVISRDTEARATRVGLDVDVKVEVLYR